MTKRFPLILMLVIVSFQTLHAQESTDTTNVNAVKSNLEVLEEEDLGKRHAFYFIPGLSGSVGGFVGSIPDYTSFLNIFSAGWKFKFFMSYEHQINKNIYAEGELLGNLLLHNDDNVVQLFDGHL